MLKSSNRRAAHDAADFAGQLAASETTVPQGAGETAGARGAARQFLNALFANKPAELFILIWLLAGKLSAWFRDAEEAAAYAERHSGQDVYVGVAMSPTDFGPHHRCKAEDTAGIVGLWTDIDFLSESHKKLNLPPTVEDARGLIPAELPPTIVIHSGHGLQVWWLFNKPQLFENAAERSAAADLANALKQYFRARAAEHGWDMDAVSDFARVMRVPGTTNAKIAGDDRPVELLELNERRYDPQEIRDFLGPSSKLLAGRIASRADRNAPSPAAGSQAVAESIILDPNSNPPLEKFEVLCENVTEFRWSWEHQRGADLKDQSPSGYDMSLADYAARVGWTDQEITNLLIAHRRKHKLDLKLRLDYVRRTISRARADAARYLQEREADENFQRLLAETAGDDSAAEPAEPAESAQKAGDGTDGDGRCGERVSDAATEGSQSLERRALILKTLSVKFGIPLSRIVKFTGDDPQYRLETDLGNVQLGNVNGLIYESKLRSSIAAATGKYLPHFEDRWPSVARLLLEVCELVDRGLDATLIGTMTDWLRGYLDHKTPHDTLEEADEGREPFRHDGAVYIFASDFRKWLGQQLNEKVAKNRLTADLRAFGAEPRTFDLLPKGKTATTRSAWRLPAGIAEPSPSDQPPVNTCI